MKQCNVDGCNNPVFGKGFCKNHQYLRIDKSIPKIKTSKPLKSSKSYNIKRTPLKKKFKTPTGELDMFHVIWDKRKVLEKQPDGRYIEVRRCEVTNEPIYDFSIGNFHHVLTKQAYPEYRLVEENILMCTLDVHYLLHTRSLSELIAEDPRYQIVQDKINFMKQEYEAKKE